MQRIMHWGGVPFVIALLYTGCETTPKEKPTKVQEVTTKVTVDPIKLGQAVRRVDALMAQDRSAEAVPQKCQTNTSDPLCGFILKYANPDRNQAWKAFNSQAKKDPLNYMAQFGMQLIYIEWKIQDQATQCYDKAIAKEPNLAVAHAKMGVAYARKGDDDKARKFFKLALSVDANDGDALLGMARLDAKIDDKDRALNNFLAASKAWPESPAPAKEAAALAESLKDSATAEKLYREAAQRAPRDVDVRRVLGALLVRLDKKDDARGVYEQIVKINPKHFAALVALAKLTEQSDDDASFGYYKKAAEAKDDDLEVQRALGRGYLKRELMSGAETSFSQVLKLEPEDGEAHLALARINEKAKRYSDAVGHYRAALRKNPDDAVDTDRKKLEKKLHIASPGVKGRSVDATFSLALKTILEAYKKRLKRKPRLGGQVTLEVSVKPEGTVDKVKIVEDTLKDEPLLACIYWNIADAQFPKAGKTRHYTYPITFEN